LDVVGGDILLLMNKLLQYHLDRGDIECNNNIYAEYTYTLKYNIIIIIIKYNNNTMDVNQRKTTRRRRDHIL